MDYGSFMLFNELNRVYEGILDSIRDIFIGKLD